MRSTVIALALVLLLPSALFARLGVPSTLDKAFAILSPAFGDGEAIPAAYTCSGRDMNPTLFFRNVPGGTRSLVLIVEDPDAPGGTWTHWLAYDIPASCTGLPENLPRSPQLPGLASQGLNSWGRAGYGGPCPPSGTHRYVFRLSALNVALRLPGGASRAQVEQAMDGHVLAWTQMVGTFRR